MTHASGTAGSSPPRAWAEIDLAALRHNLGIAAWHGNEELMAVVKANAYGHGLARVAAALGAGVRFFGVATVAEAREIRAAGLENGIFLLGPSLPEERAEILALGATPSLSSREEAKDFARLGRERGAPVCAHLMADTGMGREGFQPDALAAAWPAMAAMDGLRIEGLATHLPSADEDMPFTADQLARFRALAESLGGASRFRWIHAANSAGVLGQPCDGLTLARPGLMLYGVSPIPHPGEPPRPVMRLMGRVTLVRMLPAGHGISYGGTFRTSRPTRVATVGLGYGDGYPRAVSGKGAEVFARARRLPLLGRVTMDHVMIDATAATDLEVGDEVEFFGPKIPVAEVAEKAGTIAWEVFTGITRRVVRVYRETPNQG